MGSTPLASLSVSLRKCYSCYLYVVLQADVAPNARLLGQGKLGASNFTSLYSEDGLIKLIQTAELS